MSNPYPELDAHVQNVPVSREDVERLLAKMEDDRKAAEHNRRDAPGWAVTIAHQVIYSGCAALMAAYGCRPRVNGHHRTAIQFAKLTLPEHSAPFDDAEQVRRQRHAVMYGTMMSPSNTDVAATLKLAHYLAEILAAAALGVLDKHGGTREQ
ncbi:MAG: hypothetical protein ACRDGM_15695 [bacterium]